jgi:hypothetical protein
MLRSASTVLVAALVCAAPAIAQQTTVPPASPTIGASGGFGVGIALPIGQLLKTNAPGYLLEGLVDFSAADQPFSFRTEFIYQRFDGKSGVAGASGMNLLSLGGSIMARQPKGASSAFALAGIGIYHATGAGTKPGVSVGGGLEVPLTYFVGIADLRIHYVLTEKKPLVTFPITLGARF